MVNYRLSLVWGLLFFIVFDHAAYGQLQTLTSVGLSIFYCFYSHHMIHYRLLASVGLAQARPNNPTTFAIRLVMYLPSLASLIMNGKLLFLVSLHFIAEINLYFKFMLNFSRHYTYQ